jgi:hypothetical protein
VVFNEGLDGLGLGNPGELRKESLGVGEDFHTLSISHVWAEGQVESGRWGLGSEGNGIIGRGMGMLGFGMGELGMCVGG